MRISGLPSYANRRSPTYPGCVIFSPTRDLCKSRWGDLYARGEGERDKQREWTEENRYREETIVDKTSSESPHVRVLPLIEASGFLLKINVTSPIWDRRINTRRDDPWNGYTRSAQPNHFQNYTHEQCKRRQSLIEDVSKQAGRAGARRVYATASPKPSDSFRYLLFRAQYPTTNLINPARRRGYGPELHTYETNLHVPGVTGNFTILSIIPSSYHKKNIRFRIFRECNMDLPLRAARLGLRPSFYFCSAISDRKRILNCESINFDRFAHIIIYAPVSTIYRTLVNATC